MIDVGRDLERMQDYLVGRLSDEDQRSFEERLIRDPSLVQEVERSLRLREGLHQLKVEDYRAQAERSQARLRILVPLLAAAGVAALALLAWVEQPRITASPLLMAALQPSGPGTATPGVSAHFSFVATRAATAPDLTLPASGVIEFRAAPTVRSAGTPYRATLLRQDGTASPQPLGSVTSLGLAGDGYVHLYADAARLSAGSYSLHIENEQPLPDSSDEFSFRLRASGTAAH